MSPSDRRQERAVWRAIGRRVGSRNRAHARQWMRLRRTRLARLAPHGIEIVRRRGHESPEAVAMACQAWDAAVRDALTLTGAEDVLRGVLENNTTAGKLPPSPTVADLPPPEPLRDLAHGTLASAPHGPTPAGVMLAAA